jgi:hypothetical protein
MSTDTKEKCFDSIQDLFKKYENNEYMLQRIHNHVVNYLPSVLDNELKNHEKRVNRNMYLTNEQQIFIQVFLNKNQYYYLPNNNCFYEYDGKNYCIIKDDDIIHKLLSNISKDRILLQWKHKTKFNILKQIKERSLFTTIPETDTIQNVLNILYPYIFNTKNEAKYFLTILGDNILKKNQNLIFLANSKIKKILSEIDTISYFSVGYTNITNNFIVKYHENHSYDNCRLIKVNETSSIDIWKDTLTKNGLDLICVATHYSNRYENSDNYLNTKADEELKNYSYYLKNIPQQEIISTFCSKCFQKIINDNNNDSTNSTNTKIEWKNVHFIWKQFISSLSLPNMIYSNTLKNLLKETFSYDELSDSFINITSKYLPIESDFIKFWEKTIVIDDQNTLINTFEENTIFEEELEIDELCMLFKTWVKQNSEETLLSSGNISEENVVKILKHFFPNVEIIEDKFVLNISCTMWNKSKDIIKSFEFIKNELKKNDFVALISFDDAYNYYFKFCNSKSYKFIISKRYFEKYLYNKISEHIVYEKFIETEWLINN